MRDSQGAEVKKYEAEQMKKEDAAKAAATAAALEAQAAPSSSSVSVSGSGSAGGEGGRKGATAEGSVQEGSDGLIHQQRNGHTKTWIADLNR